MFYIGCFTLAQVFFLQNFYFIFVFRTFYFRIFPENFCSKIEKGLLSGQHILAKFFLKSIERFGKNKGLKIQFFSLFSVNRLYTLNVCVNSISRSGVYCSSLNCLQDCDRRFSKKLYNAACRVVQSWKILVFFEKYVYLSFFWQKI